MIYSEKIKRAIMEWANRRHYDHTSKISLDLAEITLNTEDLDDLTTYLAKQGFVRLSDLQQEVTEVNREKGWLIADNTFGDLVALLHSEVSEMLEAFRDHKLADATGDTYGAKPEGVGSEMADVLIRLLDMCARYNIDLTAEYKRKLQFNRTRSFQHGGRTL